jgi:hypothetical protein
VCVILAIDLSSAAYHKASNVLKQEGRGLASRQQPNKLTEELSAFIRESSGAATRAERLARKAYGHRMTLYNATIKQTKWPVALV